MPISVFLADDHMIIREGLKSFLAAEGNMVIVGEAADGSQTVQQVQQLQPDVVLMDIVMPNLNGIEATRKIKENSSNIRVIILSMYDSPEYVRQVFQVGAHGFILKESCGQEVIEGIYMVNAGNYYMSQRISRILVNEFLVKQPDTSDENLMERLSSREKEVLHLVVEGCSSVKIAEILSLSPKTVETYRSRLMDKLHISDLPALVKFALKHDLTSLD